MSEFEKLSLVLGAVQAIAIIVSLFALWWQMRQVNENMKCDAYARHVEDYSRVSELLIEHPELAKAYHARQTEVDSLSDDNKKFYNFIALVIGFYERLHNLHKRGWIDQPTWATWEVWLVEQWFPLELFEIFWRNEEKWNNADFARFIDQKYNEYSLGKKVQGGRTCASNAAPPAKSTASSSANLAGV